MIKLLQLLPKKKILLPFYHTVAEQPLPHIKHLYRMKSVKEFLADLDFLLKNFKPIDAETFYSYHLHNITPQKPVFHLTFDDGLKEIYEIVAPLLLEKGVPATFFINSGFADNKALFYRYHASLSIEKILQQGKLTDTLKTEILSCSYKNKEILFQYFTKQQVRDFLDKEKPYLTVEQIKKLSNQGFTIGSHSIDHPYYHEIPLQEQLRQTRESLDFISSIVPQKLRLFAFPFTDYHVTHEFFEAIKSDVTLSFGTANLNDEEIFFNYQRIAGENTSFKTLKTSLIKEYIKYVGKLFLGKNIVNR